MMMTPFSLTLQKLASWSIKPYSLLFVVVVSLHVYVVKGKNTWCCIKTNFDLPLNPNPTPKLGLGLFSDSGLLSREKRKSYP